MREDRMGLFARRTLHDPHNGDQTCKLCRRTSPLISATLKLCLECIRIRPADALRIAEVVGRNVDGLHGRYDPAGRVADAPLQAGKFRAKRGLGAHAT